MSKGAGYAPEFRAKAVGLSAEARGSRSSEARAVEQAAKDPGVVPEMLRRWRDKADARSRRRLGSRPGRDDGVEGFAGRGRAIEERERDIDDGDGFFRGQARPGTALVVACVDGFRDRSRVGPVCGAPAASPGCGFVTPRGCRVSRSGPVSRMATRREAPARGILGVHAGFFMAVYGCRKTRARSSAQGRDPAGIGRGWACATTMDTRELPLQALEQAISWAASHGSTDGLVHHADHGVRYISTVCTTRVMKYGMLPSTGTVGDSYDNAMAESADGAYRTELVWRRQPFRDLAELELATFRWVSWRGLEASAPVLGLQDTRTDRNRVLCKPSGASRPTIRAE